MIERVYETVIYAEDVQTAASFYVDALGLRLVEEPDELLASFRLPDRGLLLVFDPRVAAQPGRMVPSHGTTGAGHVAFAVGRGSLDDWAERLGERGIEIEQAVDWDAGGRSLYLRDPAGNSVELVDRDIWPA